MKEAYDKIKAFHEKYGFPVEIPLHKNKDDRQGTNLVLAIAHSLQSEAMRIEQMAVELQEKGDQRLYRTHLLTEELGECLEALGNGDEVKFLDGLCDLLYVAIGTAVAFDLPISEGFDEVHGSNMSKPTRTDNDPRMRKRPDSYYKPDLAKILGRRRGICEFCGGYIEMGDPIYTGFNKDVVHLTCEGAYLAKLKKEYGVLCQGCGQVFREQQAVYIRHGREYCKACEAIYRELEEKEDG